MALDYNEVARQWLDGDLDSETKAKVLALRDTDPVGFEDAFYRNLEFGTGGLRGKMGVGTNRINKYTIGMATQGLANYIRLASKATTTSISYDSRTIPNRSPRLLQTC